MYGEYKSILASTQQFTMFCSVRPPFFIIADGMPWFSRQMPPDTASIRVLLFTESGTKHSSRTRAIKTPYLLSLLCSCWEWRCWQAARIAEVIQESLALLIFYHGSQASRSLQTNETPLMIDVQSCTVWNEIKNLEFTLTWEMFKTRKSLWQPIP